MKGGIMDDFASIVYWATVACYFTACAVSSLNDGDGHPRDVWFGLMLFGVAFWFVFGIIL